MSAARLLQAATVARLAGVGRVFDAPPTRSAMPYLVVEHPVLAADDAVGVAGRRGMLAVTCSDGGSSPERVRASLAAVETALAALPGAIGEGWRVTAVRLARSTVGQAKGEGWSGTSVFAVRMYRIN
ncbi:MAG: DUF3168 domain-containing protein [Sphingomonas sp.]